MTAFVLDNSIAILWLLASNKASDQKYAELVLKSLVDAEALVPNLWHLEAANVLLSATNRKEIEISEAERFTVQLAKAMGVGRKTVNELCGNKRGVTAETAFLLSKVLGTTPDFWINLQISNDLWLTAHSEKFQEKIALATLLVKEAA